MFTQEEAAKRPGVYVLFGPNLEDDQDMIYIGEADPLGRRLIRHQAKKDFWNTAYIFTAQDDHLNKALIQYLEKELLSHAKDAERCRLDNEETGNNISLSPMDQADANAFLKNMLLCCPVMGLRAFEKLRQLDSISRQGIKDEFPSSEGSHQQITTLYSLKGKDGAEGKGYESPKGFTVLQGARWRKGHVDSAPESLLRKRDSLIDQGIFKEEGGAIHLTKDYEFSSSTAAAMILLGRTASGPVEWKDDTTGKTLKQRQAEQLQDAIHQEENSSQDITHDQSDSQEE